MVIIGDFGRKGDGAELIEDQDEYSVVDAAAEATRDYSVPKLVIEPYTVNLIHAELPALDNRSMYCSNRIVLHELFSLDNKQACSTHTNTKKRCKNYLYLKIQNRIYNNCR